MNRNIVVSILFGIVLIPLAWLYINDYLPIKYHKSAREVISLAHKESDNGNYKKAIKLWEQSLRLKPYHPEGVYHDIGMSYNILKKYDKAIEPLTKSIEIDKNNGSSYYNRGLAYYYLNKAEKAKEDFKKTIEINKPSHPDEI